MIKPTIVLSAITGCLLGNLTACGTVTRYFPDKEQAYQHVKEIPMLNWPTELRTPTASSTVEPATAPEQPVAGSQANNNIPLPADNNPQPPVPANPLPASNTATQTSTGQPTDTATASSPEASRSEEHTSELQSRIRIS